MSTPTTSDRSPSPSLRGIGKRRDDDNDAVVIEVGPPAELHPPRLPPSPPLTIEEIGEHKDEHAFASTPTAHQDHAIEEEDIAESSRPRILAPSTSNLDLPSRTDADEEDTPRSRTFEVIRSKQPSPMPYQKPRSSYYVGPPGAHSAFGTPQLGQIGVHDPREIVRVERDYTSGELPQFSPTFPLELEGRITATQFIETINAVNEILISAYSLRHAAFDNTVATMTLYISKLFLRSHYDKEMGRLAQLLDALNAELYNPRGLNILWPRRSAFLFLEIEYY